MSFVLLQTVAEALGPNGGTTTAADFSGCDLIVIGIANDPSVSIGVANVGDSAGNTNIVKLGEDTSTGQRETMFEIWNAIVSATQTFTLGGVGGSFDSIVVKGYSGSQTTSDPADALNGNAANLASSIQTGSVTPSVAGELLVTALGCYTDLSAPTIDSSFNTPDFVAFGAGDHYALAMSDKIQTSAGAENPTWTTGGSLYLATRIATFKPAAASGDTLFAQACL